MITAIAIVAFLALTCLLAFGTGWNNVLSPDRNELVFAGRNQEYGAYKIRQEHHRTMILAMGIGVGLVGAGLLVPRLFAEPVAKAAVPYLPIPEVIFETITIDPIKPADIIKPTVTPPRTDPAVPNGIPVAVDSMEVAPKDTTSTNPDPDPKGGGDPGPKGGDPGSGKGPADTGKGNLNTGPKQGYEVDVMPEYPGGEKALYGYLSDEVDYPMIDVRNDVQGRVWISFVVSEDGTIVDATLLNSISPTIDAEALRVVRKMRKWKPGKVQGHDVSVRYKLPIVFKLAQ